MKKKYNIDINYLKQEYELYKDIFYIIPLENIFNNLISKE